MKIQLEKNAEHAVQAYTEHTIQVQDRIYDRSLILSKEEIIPNLTIKSIQEMDEAYLELLTKHQPKIILIGHQEAGKFLPPTLLNSLFLKGIGIECMSLGAACRTFNILLSENREVVAGFILNRDTDEPK